MVKKTLKISHFATWVKMTFLAPLEFPKKIPTLDSYLGKWVSKDKSGNLSGMEQYLVFLPTVQIL